jgi:hypothetical protein
VSQPCFGTTESKRRLNRRVSGLEVEANSHWFTMNLLIFWSAWLASRQGGGGPRHCRRTPRPARATALLASSASSAVPGCSATNWLTSRAGYSSRRAPSTSSATGSRRRSRSSPGAASRGCRRSTSRSTTTGSPQRQTPPSRTRADSHATLLCTRAIEPAREAKASKTCSIRSGSLGISSFRSR